MEWQVGVDRCAAGGRQDGAVARPRGSRSARRECESLEVGALRVSQAARKGAGCFWPSGYLFRGPIRRPTSHGKLRAGDGMPACLRFIDKGRPGA